MPAFNRASHLVSIRARSGQSHRLGLRLQELAQAGQAAPGCLRYELRQADGDADLWLLHHPDLRRNARVRATHAAIVDSMARHLPLFSGRCRPEHAPSGPEIAPGDSRDSRVP